MKKKIFPMTLLMLMPLSIIFAQQVDYNKIILPDGSSNISIEERLVQLAWKNNPLSEMANQDILTAEFNFKVSKTSWTDQLGATFNLNEFTIQRFNPNYDPATVALNNFPRYNIYLRLPMSTFFQQPHQRKAAQSRVEFSKEKLNLLKLEIRARVLRLYSEFKKNELIYGIRRDALADEESNYLLIEEKFRNGNISLEEYTRGQKGRNDMRIQSALAENLYNQSKIDLEEVIGVRLEDVSK